LIKLKVINLKSQKMRINLTHSLVIAFATLSVLLTSNAAAQWNTNTSVNLEISGLNLADMQTASTTDGKLWTAFYSQNGGSYDMRAQLFDAQGNKLLGDDGFLVSNQPTGTATFVFNVCVDADNNLVIGCQDQRTGTMQAVLYKISQSGTHLWSSSGLILGAGLAPYVGLLSNGEIIAAWNADAGSTVNLQKVTLTGALAWTTPIPVLVSGTGTTRGQVVGNTNGTFTMIFQKKGVAIYTTLYAQRFNNNGTALYAPVQLCNETTHGVRYYSVVAEGDVTYCGYYSASGSRFNSYLQRVNADGSIPYGMNGSHFNTSTSSSDSYQMVTNIALAPDSDYVWAVSSFCNTSQSQYGVYVQKFLKTTGARQFTDQAKVVYPISTNFDQQTGNLVLVNDTPIFMTYQSDYKIFVTKLDASGDFVWPYYRTEISSTTAGAGSPKGRYGFNNVGPNWCAGTWQEDRNATELGFIQGISNGGLFAIDVATQGGVPATITTPAGTLQMTATIWPDYASQNVTWSIVPVTGLATINTTGLVTASNNGTVWAKATSVQDNMMKDSLLITISGQQFIAPDVVTLPATQINQTAATLNGTVNSHNFTNAISFEWGLTNTYGNTISAIPAQVTSTVPVEVYANLSGLAAGTTYHFRCVANHSGTITYGNDEQFTTDCLLAGDIGEITGTNGVCGGATGIVFSVAPFAGAITYVWSFPEGAVITAGANTNSVTVDFPTTALSGDITVYASDGVCYTLPSPAFPISVFNIPAPAGNIVGGTLVCEGDQGVPYAVDPITGSVDYIWSLPEGAVIASGANTYAITVNFNAGAQSGDITVYATNSCGTGLTSPPLSIFVTPLPGDAGEITGPTEVCAGSTGMVYSVTPIQNAYNYYWSLPAGAQITAGQNTSEITVAFGMSAGSGEVSVYATNGNCVGQASIPLTVTINPVPETPVITQTDFTLTSSAPEGNQWYKDGILIDGATAQTYEVTENGTYTVVVTLNGCSSEPSNALVITGVGISNPGFDSFVVYPNPGKGEFWMQVKSNGLAADYELSVQNTMGSLVFHQNNKHIDGAEKLHLNLNFLPDGMYTLTLKSASTVIIQKLVLRR